MLNILPGTLWCSIELKHLDGGFPLLLRRYVTFAVWTGLHLKLAHPASFVLLAAAGSAVLSGTKEAQNNMAVQETCMCVLVTKGNVHINNLNDSGCVRGEHTTLSWYLEAIWMTLCNSSPRLSLANQSNSNMGNVF